MKKIARRRIIENSSANYCIYLEINNIVFRWMKDYPFFVSLYIFKYVYFDFDQTVFYHKAFYHKVRCFSRITYAHQFVLS